MHSANVYNMKFSIYHACLLFFLVSYSVVRADIGRVHVALEHKLQTCLITSNSAQGNFAHLLQCIESSLYRCVLFHEPLTKYVNTNIYRVCGVVNSGHHLKPYVWKINVHPEFNLTLNFLHFRLSLALNCVQAYLTIIVPGSPSYMYPKSSLGRYCGYRMPWSFYYMESQATVILFTKWKLAHRYYFVMTFEAFDNRLPSLGYIHRDERLYKKDGINWMSPQRHPNFNFFKETEFQILFYATVVQQIILTYPPAIQFSRFPPLCGNLPEYYFNLSDVRVYDGPGILSPLVGPSCNASTGYCTCYLSSYQGLMKYRISETSSLLNSSVKHNSCYNHKEDQGILWANNEVLNSSLIVLTKEKIFTFTASRASAGASHSTALSKFILWISRVMKR